MNIKQFFIEYERLKEDLEKAINLAHNPSGERKSRWNLTDMEIIENRLEISLENWHSSCGSEYFGAVLPLDVVEMAEHPDADFVGVIQHYLETEIAEKKERKRLEAEQTKLENEKRRKESEEVFDQKEYLRLKKKYEG